MNGCRHCGFNADDLANINVSSFASIKDLHSCIVVLALLSWNVHFVSSETA